MIKAFSDNYIWAVSSLESKHMALVDPGDAQVCIDFIRATTITVINYFDHTPSC